MIKIYDISLSLSQDTPIYPNNPPLLINELRSLSEHPTSLTKIEMGVHTGTHVDAPSHAVVSGKTMGRFPSIVSLAHLRYLILLNQKARKI